MKSLNTAKGIIEFIVASAGAIMTFKKLWDQFGPEVKKALKPVVDSAKKIADTDFNQELKAIEEK